MCVCKMVQVLRNITHYSSLKNWFLLQFILLPCQQLKKDTHFSILTAVGHTSVTTCLVRCSSSLAASVFLFSSLTAISLSPSIPTLTSCSFL